MTQEEASAVIEKYAGRLHRGIIALMIIRCECGNAKGRKMSSYRSCYYKLPRQMQRNLYKRAGEGYEEAYDAAMKYLEERER
ncbi:MAG TPA: hypothetical protein VIC84_23045 [Blastocatellia bacterium]|jgi:hypothetical protein